MEVVSKWIKTIISGVIQMTFSDIQNCTMVENSSSISINNNSESFSSDYILDKMEHNFTTPSPIVNNNTLSKSNSTLLTEKRTEASLWKDSTHLSSTSIPPIILLNSNSSITPMETGEMIATLIPLCAIIVFILFGNSLVIAAVFRRRSLRTPQNIYLVSLAFVDLSVGLFILPLNILNQVQGGWTLGNMLCKFYVTLDITLCTMSIMHLCAIALDRYKAITEGIQYIQRRTLRRVLLTIVVITVLSIWISSPPILGWDKDWLADIDETKKCELLQSQGYVVYSAFGSLFFPLIMMISLYVLIYYSLRERIRKRAKVDTTTSREKDLERSSEHHLTEDTPSADGDLDEDDSPKSSDTKTLEKEGNMRGKSQQFKDFIAMKQKFSLRKEKSAAQTLGIIMAAFIVCWFPFSFMYVLVPFCCSDRPPPKAVFEALTWLGYLNSALNPIIYSIFNLEFRKAFKSLLHLS